MKRKKIAILGANEPLRVFYEQAKALGYKIISFAWEEGAVCKEMADRFYPISILEKEEIASICKKMGVDGVNCFSLESAVPSVNFISRFLGLPANSERSEHLSTNKYSMRACFQHAGLSIPKFKIVFEHGELDEIKIDYPLIVKPVDSGGSRGVTKADTKDALIQAICRAKQYSVSGGVLIEEFIDGEEFSVEYITYQGKHFFVALTEKKTTGSPYFVELEHHQPANVTADLLKRILSLTESALSALNFEIGPSHTEVKVNKAGIPYIIEIGLRMGGDMITSDLVRLSTGYDFTHAVIELSTGNFIKPEVITRKYSGIYFLSLQSPAIEKYIRNYTQHPEIVRSVLFNEQIKEIRESNDRAGYFVYQSDRKFIAI